MASLIQANPAWVERVTPLTNIVAPKKLAICIRPAQAQLLSFVFDRENWESTLRALCERLTQSVPVSLSFSNTLTFFRGSGTMSLGRRLCISDLQGAYAPWEISAACSSSPFSALSSEDFESAIQLLASTQTMVIAADDLMKQHPLEHRSYSLQELAGDPRVRDLVSATARVSALFESLPISPAVDLGSDRIVDDLERFKKIATQFLQAIRGEAPGWTASMALLSTNKPFSLVRRITHLYANLAQQARESRAPDHDARRSSHSE